MNTTPSPGMTPGMQIAMALLGLLASPGVGILINAALARVLPAHSRIRAATTTYLGATAGQAQAVYSAMQKGPDQGKRIAEAVDAVATGIKLAAEAAEKDDEDAVK